MNESLNLSPKQIEILWEDGGLVDQPWLQLFALWASGHTDELDFQQNPVPQRLQALLEARARLAAVEANSELRERDYDELTARLAEAEAERDNAALLSNNRIAEQLDVEARLAAVEAERDAQRSLVTKLAEGSLETARLLTAAEARLAAVEALCDDTDDFGQSNYDIPRAWIRAAARGEGDRPAEPWPACRDHHEVQHRDGKPPWCKKCGWNRGRPPVPPRLIRGEGDR